MIMLSESKFQKEYIDKKGIHVIVGQYNGKSFPWIGSPNLTEGKRLERMLYFLHGNELSSVISNGNS